MKLVLIKITALFKRQNKKTRNSQKEYRAPVPYRTRKWKSLWRILFPIWLIFAILKALEIKLIF